jgi:hypothetical protein
MALRADKSLEKEMLNRYLRICSLGFAFATACMPGALDFEVPIQSLELSPKNNVQPNQSVMLVLGHALSSQNPMPILRVTSASERAWPFALHETESLTQWEIRPKEPWPIDSTMRIALMKSDGETQYEVRFQTGRPDGAGRFDLSVIAPPPGEYAPPNLRFLAVEVTGAAITLKRFVLNSPNHRLIAPVVERLSPDVLLLEIPKDSLECLGLCPRSRYEISADEIGEEKQAVVEIQTGTIADMDAPQIQVSQLDVWGDFLRVSVSANEWVILRGWITPTGGEALELRVHGSPGREIVLESTEALLPNTTYATKIVATDLCGQSTTITLESFKTIGELRISINELVPSPLHDWSDSSANKQAYDAFPGMGAVTDADEWIELVNDSDQAIIIGTAGLYVRGLDSTPTETWLSKAPGIRIGDGLSGNTWGPGQALVFRPQGRLNQTDFIIEVYSGRRLLDRLVIGDQLDSEHSGGRPPDLEHEALAKDTFGSWRWCTPSPGTAKPAEDCY